MDPKWQECDFEQLIEVLRHCTLRNPESPNRRPNNILRKETIKWKNTSNEIEKTCCVYYTSQNHRSHECRKLHSTQQRKP